MSKASIPSKDIDNIFDEHVKYYTKKYGVKKTTMSDDLSQIGKKELGSKFKGVFSLDQYNPKMPNYSLCIVNTDPISKPGEHWISIYNTPKQFYVYDSFGRQSNRLIKSLYNKMKGTGKSIIDSKKDAEQLDREKDCGIKSLSWLAVVKKYGIKNAIKI